MARRLSKEARSRLMARIRGSNTGPELRIRRLLHSLGYRFRVHLRGVPGRPDIAFSRKKKVIFIHGCFWHNHEDCPSGRIPKTRSAFWRKKFEKNKERDRRQLREVSDIGWKSLVIWECELSDKALSAKLSRFLGRPKTKVQ